MAGAVIRAVRTVAAHDGTLELLVQIEHGNGGCTDIALDTLGTAALLRACGTDDPDGVIGHGWDKVRDALGVSWNRYMTGD